MLKPIICLAGLLLLLGLLAMPATALAAPTITITPTAVPRGGEVTVTGSGFAPNAALTAVLEVEGSRRVPVADLTAAADRTIRLAFRIPTSAPVAPGGTTVTLLILARADQAVLARGQLTVTDAPPVTAEQVTIDPPSGPAGTRFVATGTGFTAGASLRLVVAPTATGAQTPPERQVNLGTVQVGADGRFTVTIDSTGYRPEQYDFVALTGAPGPPLVARFTVTAAGAPGLPNTGSGGSIAQSPHAWWILGGLLIVAAAGLGGGLRRGRPRRGRSQG